MKVSKILRNLAVFTALATLFISPLTTLAEMREPTDRPNIIFIFVDDMGYADLSCFGNPAMETPRLDGMAREGIKMTNFYTNSPICSPARTAAITGQYPQRWGIHSFLAAREQNRNRSMPDWLDPQAPSIARVLLNRGYRTAHFGKWHLGGGRDVGDAPYPQAYGFEESLVAFEGLGDRIIWSDEGLPEMSRQLGRGKLHFEPKHRTTEIYVDRTIDFMERHRDQPFFIQLWTNDPHDPFMPSDEMLDRWKDAPGSDEDRKFFAVIENLDKQVGRLLDAVDKMGLAENTLVIFTSDNGPTDWPRYYRDGILPPGYTGPFFGRKWSLYEGGIRMPFIARWSGVIPAGVKDDTTIAAVFDFLPTFASLAGARIHPDNPYDGIDISSVLKGEPMVRPHPLFFEYGVLGSIAPGNRDYRSPRLAVRDGDWKLMVNPNGSRLELYNLALDPGEENNLADAMPDVVSRLRPAAMSWWAEMLKSNPHAGD